MRTLINTLLTLSVLALQAQSTDVVTLRDESNTVVNGQTLTVHGAPADIDLQTVIVAELNGTSSRTINVLRRELNVVPGAQNYLSWATGMYLPLASGAMPTWVCPVPEVMAPQTTDQLVAYYRPNGTSANACFRHVWYDVDNPTDSAWVNLCFDTQTTIGLEEAATTGTFLELYPNPVNVGTALSFAYRLGTAGTATAVFYNALGARAMVLPLNSLQDRTTLPTTNLAPGVWSVRVEQNGRAVATRRLVITQ